MKNYIRGAVVVGVILLSAGCSSGEVSDKRALGEPGRKVFQLQIDGSFIDRWVTVSETQWDDCGMFEEYPACVG
jgi:hypothetical protein